MENKFVEVERQVNSNSFCLQDCLFTFQKILLGQIGDFLVVQLQWIFSFLSYVSLLHFELNY